MSSACSFSFGGAHVRPGQYFAANGNAASLSLANFLDVGTAIVLPVPMRIVAVSWAKLDATPGSFILMDVGRNLLINVSGVNGATPIEFGEPFNGVIKLRSLSTNDNNAFRSCQITLYFQPLGILGVIGMNAIPFGGYYSFKVHSLRCIMRLGADNRTDLDNTGAYVGTKFTVPSRMRLYRLGYQKHFTSVDTYPTLQLFKNGAAVRDGMVTLVPDEGVFNFPNMAINSPDRQLEAGDVIQLVFTSGVPRILSCVITLYTTQQMVP
jgi:hypothetical protein